MEVAKVTSKGQITIPISIRRKLEINEGDKVLFIYKSEGVMMVNPNTYKGVAGEEDEAVVSEPAVKTAAAAQVEVTEKSPEPAAPVKPIEPAAEAASAPEQTAPRPVPPPVEEPPQQEKHVAGLNLSSLLDDIRSIGSNI